MKRSFLLVLVAVAITFSGCLKQEYTPPNGATYGAFLYDISKVTFYATGSGANMIKFENGSRAEYEDNSIDNAFFFNMTVYYVPGEGEGEEWEGEYKLSNPDITLGGFEYRYRYRDKETWDIVTGEVSDSFFRGTIKIKHVSGNKYKITLDATTSGLEPLTALFEGNVLMVE